MDGRAGIRVSPAAVAVREVGAESRPVIERLGQLMRHDMSEFLGALPDSDGRFDFGRLPLFFSEPARRAYLIHDGPDLAGFALTRPLDSGATSVAEFFVVRALRGRGVGHQAALKLLATRAGPWAIAFQQENPGAGRFWRRVATRAVGSAWREERWPVPGQPDVPPDSWLLFDTRG